MSIVRRGDEDVKPSRVDMMKGMVFVWVDGCECW